MRTTSLCRIISLVLVAIALFTMAGCLDQGVPPPLQPVDSPNLFSGAIIIEDVKGATDAGIVEALFGPVQAPTPAQAAHSAKLKFSRTLGGRLDVSRRYAMLAKRALTGDPISPACELDPTTDDVVVLPDQPADSGTRQASDDTLPTKLMSVGELQFGPEEQNYAADIPSDDSQVYAAGIPSGFPSNIYIFAAAGEGNVPAFQKDVSMPEILDGLTVNGTAFAPTGLSVHQAQALTLGWNAPMLFNSNNYVVLDIFAKGTDNVEHQIHCFASEDPLVSAGTNDLVSWQLPANALSGLPQSTSATFYFSRANLVIDPSAPITVRLQGLRTFTGTVTVAP